MVDLSRAHEQCDGELDCTCGILSCPQEGRGIGLANKVAAYALQDGGLDTVDANRHLGFEDDERSYEAVDYILGDMGIKVSTPQTGHGIYSPELPESEEHKHKLCTVPSKKGVGRVALAHVGGLGSSGV